MRRNVPSVSIKAWNRKTASWRECWSNGGKSTSRRSANCGKEYDPLRGRDATQLERERCRATAKGSQNITVLFGTRRTQRPRIARRLYVAWWSWSLCRSNSTASSWMSRFIGTGGSTSQHQVVRPVGLYSQLRDYDRLTPLIKELHQQGKTVPAIAKQSNKDGFSPPRRRGVFSVDVWVSLLQQLGLVNELRRQELLGPGPSWVRDLAVQLKVRPGRIYYWASQGWVHAAGRSQVGTGSSGPISVKLARLEKLKALSNSYTAKRHPKLVMPKAREG